MARGRTAAHIGNPGLRAARQRRGWTEDDAAIALQTLAVELGEPEPAVSGSQVSKWERGVRNPGRHYKPRLCLVFEATPEEIGLPPNPRLLRDIGDLARRRAERLRHPRTGGGGVHDSLPIPSESAFPHVEPERLNAALRRLWSVDRPLVDGLARAGGRLSQRTDSESPGTVLPDLREYLSAIERLLSRSQPSDLAARLMVLASIAAQHAGFLYDVAGQWGETYSSFAVSEALARESGDHNQLAMVLVNKAEVLHRRTHGPEGLGPATTLGEAAELAVEPDARAGLLGWIFAERAVLEAEVGEDLASGRLIDLAYRATAGATPEELNLFSDYDSSWLEQYRGQRALALSLADEAIEAYGGVLASTDPRLLWERARALIRLATAWAKKGEVERASALLGEAVELATRTRDQRSLTLALRVRDRELGRWRSDPHVRELDEVIRTARKGMPPAGESGSDG